MKKTTRHSSMHIFRAFNWSLKGLYSAFRNEIAFRQEVYCFVVLFPLGLYLGRTATEKIALAGCLLLVLITELLNSSIEAAVDRMGDEIHPLAGRAKDMGSAAVFIALANVALVWGILLYDMFM
ncbi:MAG TPA: diacylglycerol kinase [Desulfobacteraceae bacterium]|nr:diacylglycerol kinase [Desulfobacteraceae bacterium]